MSIATEKHGEVLVLRPLGMLDFARAAELDQRARAAIAAGTRRLVFDLSALEHLSAEGLRVMLEAHRRLADCDGVAAIVAPAHEAAALLERTGVRNLISTAPTLEEALAHAG